MTIVSKSGLKTSLIKPKSTMVSTIKFPASVSLEDTAQTIQTWLEQNWPLQRFSKSFQKTGHAIWDARITDGNQFAVWLKVSGYSNKRLSFGLSGRGYVEWHGKLQETEWLQPALDALSSAIIQRQKEEHGYWLKPGITPEDAEAVAVAGQQLLAKALRLNQGSVFTGGNKNLIEKCATGNWNAELQICPHRGHENHLYLTLASFRMNQKAGCFEISTFFGKQPTRTRHNSAAKFAQAINQITEELPQLVKTLPGATQAIIFGHEFAKWQEFFQAEPKSAKISFERDCSASTKASFLLYTKENPTRLEILCWLRHGGLEYVLPREIPKGGTAQREDGRKVYFPRPCNADVLSTEVSTTPAEQGILVEVVWQGENLED